MKLRFCFFLLLSLTVSISSYGQEPLKVMIFNIQKMTNYGWDFETFSKLVKDSDISLLQEAIDSVPLVDEEINWRFYKSWENDNYQTGLATLSKYSPDSSEILFSPTNEPISNTPKISVIERYNLEGRGRSLVVVNTHGINFRGLSHFKRQMNAVFEKIKNDKGPMIWAGDFNTRTSARTKYLRGLAKQIGLKEVHFENRSSLLFTLDRAFVRGFKVISALENRVDISDHEPLVMELDFVKDPDGNQIDLFAEL